MAQPTARQVHTDRPLTMMSVGFRQEFTNFIAEEAFPLIGVPHQSDLYYTYDKADWYRIEAAERPPCAQSVGSGWNLNTDNYFCKPYAIHKEIADQVRGNQDPAINMNVDATRYVTLQLRMLKDLEWRQKFFNANAWTFNATPGVAKWNQPTAELFRDIQSQMDVVEGRTGYRPNKLVVPRKVWTAMTEASDFMDRIKYTQRGVLTQELIASMLGLDKVLVASAVYNPGPESVATPKPDNTRYIMDENSALLVYSAPNPGLMVPSAGYNFRWTGLPGSAGGMRVKRMRRELEECDRIEAQENWAQKVVAPDLGVFFEDLLA